MANLRSYNQLTYYDPGLDGQAICYIGYSGQGSYTIRALLAPAGRKRRAQKEEMLVRLEVAIRADQPPGEVSMAGPLPETVDEFDPGIY